MIPPVFITLTVNDCAQRFNVATISNYYRAAGRNGTWVVTLEPLTSDEEGGYSAAETPEEIDELIRKATEPYTAAFHRLFQPAFIIHHDF